MINKEHLLSIGNDRLRRMATYASVVAATLLIIAKLFAYFLTDSVAMLSSLLDSTIDLLAALVTAYGVASALQPPDREHRYGHGKAEPLAALAQAAFIVGSAVLLGYEALSRLYHPHGIENEMLGYAVMAVAIILTTGLIAFQHYVISRTSSMAIGADKLHYIGDLVINFAVIAAFGLHELTGSDLFDPLFAIAIAGGLAFGAFHIAMQALHVLMDHELPEEDRTKIKKIVQSQSAVKGIHDMRTRSDSDRIFIELHVEMDGGMDLISAHKVAEDIEEAILKDFPSADIMIHQDPEGLEEERLDAKIVRRAK